MKRALLSILPLLAAACRSAEPSPYCPPPAPPPLDAAYAASNGLDAATAYFTDYDRDGLPAYVEQALGLSATNAHIPPGVSDWRGASDTVSPEWKHFHGIDHALDAQGGLDPDGDGWDTYAEMLAGTKPLDAGERPAPSIAATVRSASDIAGSTLHAWAWPSDADVHRPPSAVLAGRLARFSTGIYSATLSVVSGGLSAGGLVLWLWAGGDEYSPLDDPAGATDLAARPPVVVSALGGSISASLCTPGEVRFGLPKFRVRFAGAELGRRVMVATLGGSVISEITVYGRDWICDLDYTAGKTEHYVPGWTKHTPSDNYPNEFRWYVDDVLAGTITNWTPVACPVPSILPPEPTPWGGGWARLRLPDGVSDFVAIIDGVRHPAGGTGNYPAPSCGASADISLPVWLAPGNHTISCHVWRPLYPNGDTASASATVVAPPASASSGFVRVRLDAPAGASATLTAHADPACSGRALASSQAAAGGVAALGPLPLHTPLYVRATGVGCTSYVSRATAGGRHLPLACFADWSTNRVVILPR